MEYRQIGAKEDAFAAMEGIWDAALTPFNADGFFAFGRRALFVAAG